MEPALDTLFGSSGILNAIFIPVALYICWDRNERFSFTEKPLSIAGRSATKKLFAAFVICAAVLQSMFIANIFYTFPEMNTPPLTILLFVGIAALILTGLVSSNTSFVVHRAGVLIMMLTLTIWSFLFHYAFLSISSIVGLSGLFLSLLSCIGVPFLYYRFGQFGVSALLFSGVVIAWNILFTLGIYYI